MGSWIEYSATLVSGLPTVITFLRSVERLLIIGEVSVCVTLAPCGNDLILKRVVIALFSRLSVVYYALLLIPRVDKTLLRMSDGLQIFNIVANHVLLSLLVTQMKVLLNLRYEINSLNLL